MVFHVERHSVPSGSQMLGSPNNKGFPCGSSVMMKEEATCHMYEGEWMKQWKNGGQWLMRNRNGHPCLKLSVYCTLAMTVCFPLTGPEAGGQLLTHVYREIFFLSFGNGHSRDTQPWVGKAWRRFVWTSIGLIQMFKFCLQWFPCGETCRQYGGSVPLARACRRSHCP